jgi:hypothetical protein
MELPVADVDRGDARSARLEERVGEPARGGAHVRAVFPGDLDLERGVSSTVSSTCWPGFS